MDTLQKYKEKPLYEVPEHFFEQFQHDVMQRVADEEKRQKTFRRWISAAGVAASFALIFTLSYFIFVNRNANEPFYVHENMAHPEDSILNFDSNSLADAKINIVEEPIESIETQETVFTKDPPADAKESIVYRAVDFYLDDYETNNFCEAMYDLECYYDY
jgi:hypothetical protein